jgi:ABC-type multidrug transport system fused ATPase/permease subunit
MDRIVIFDNGKIVGDGTHTELKQISEVYRKLWDSHIDGVIM